MTAPTQRPASRSDVRKRKHEQDAAGIDYHLVFRIIASDPCPAEALRSFVRQEIEAAASRTPDAHLAAAKAEALEEAAAELLTWPSTIDGSCRAAESCGEFAAWLRARAARLREQGGDQ